MRALWEGVRKWRARADRRGGGGGSTQLHVYVVAAVANLPPPPPGGCMLHGMSMSTLALQCQQVRCPNCSTTLPLLACEIRLP